MAKHPIFGPFVKLEWLWRFMVLLLTFIINIMILATWEASYDLNESTPITPDW
jgi:hypothetical protein